MDSCEADGGQDEERDSHDGAMSNVADPQVKQEEDVATAKQPSVVDKSATNHDEITLSASSKFEVDVNQIESVMVEDQDAEIKSLGLTVYNQSTLEKGIWDQVEQETRKREAQEELASVTTKLKLAEEQLKRVESAKSVKRSILQSALEEPSKKKPNSDVLKTHQKVTQEKLKELHSKKARLQAQLSGSNPPRDADSKQESEIERKIRMGEMTPFGTSLGATSSNLSSFEKYLKNQQELHKKMLNGVSTKKKQNVSMQGKEEKSERVLELSPLKKETLNKTVLKKSILFPKKRKSKEMLGTDTSALEENQQSLPGEVPGEKAVVDLEESGSDYVPSGSDEDADFHSETSGRQRYLPRQSIRKDKQVTPPSVKKRNGSDRWAGGSLKKRKNHIKEIPDGDAENWNSDDSDWICTDDEDFSSDDGKSGRRGKQSSKGVKDDGSSECFFRRVKQWEKQNEGLREQMENEVHEFENGFKIPTLIWDKLYMYQQVGVRWMWELNQQRCGGILGDEMGLGKTIEIISFLAGLSISKIKCRSTGYRGLGPTLIVCPTTVMHQWVREFHSWFPPARVAVLHESGSYDGKRSQLVRDMLQDKGILITSYTAVVRLKDSLLHQRWHYVILDEGHKIRNPDAQVTLAVKQLRTPHRLILSGSPLQNHLRELWSLMDFVFPGKLGTLPVFMSEFAVPINQGGYSNASEVMVATAYKCATVLRDTISPYLLRRMKADVSEHIKLPSKNEQVLFCRLTDEQRDLYKEYLQCGEVGRILEGRCQIFVGLINLRKICNHPHLFSGEPKLFAHEKVEDIKEVERFGYWEKAGKMIVIESLLKIWYKQEHRVLIFTQSRQMLLIIEKFVSERGYPYLKMDGGTSIAARQPLITKFNENKSYFVMLLTTKVGGLGVNLTGANRVVIYDPDWNPATDTQARERAWRIGQQNAVTVYRLITAGTIEEKMYHRQIFKQFLCNKVLKDPRQRRFFKSNDLLELFTLKETDDGTTETSAIFAGTNSQVHVKPKRDSQKSTKYKEKSHHPHKYKHESIENHGYASRPDKQNKCESTAKINFSQDKLDHMKKLAHELSLKFSKKVATTKEKVDQNDPNKRMESSTDSCINHSNLTSEDVTLESLGETSSIDDKNSGEVLMLSKKANRSKLAQDPEFETISAQHSTSTELLGVDDSDEELEDMKQLAQELSKELSQKVQAAAVVNQPMICGRNTDVKNELKENGSVHSDGDSLTESSNFSTFDSGKKQTKSESSFTSENQTCKLESASCDKSPFSHHRLNISPTSSHSLKESQIGDKHKVTKCHKPSSSSKHKKSKKHKKHKSKDAIFEGERVRGLIKSSALEEKSKEEVQEQASHNSKQDDYVLRKLFSKTGITTAMQHERIMESGHADYALVEGEARRVAQDAVRNMKASRQQCWTPMSGQPTWTGTSGRIRAPEERENRSEEGESRPHTSRPKFGKKKPPLKKLGSEVQKETDVEGVGSSALLARIRARNLLLTEEDDDDNTAASTSAASSVPDSNRELLDDIRTFVSFGASVDGRATTDEIVSMFRDRLPAQSSALFKQLLMQICEFHRMPSGQGVWKLIPDFNW